MLSLKSDFIHFIQQKNNLISPPNMLSMFVFLLLALLNGIDCTCPSSSWSYLASIDKCFHLSLSQGDYIAGRVYCSELGSQLAMINQYSLAFLINSTFNAKNIWVGLTYGTSWKWWDGSIFGSGSVGWVDTFPVGNTLGTCAIRAASPNQATLTAVQCNTQAYFLCQKASEPIWPQCPNNGWQLADGGYCRKLFTNALSWDNANTKCATTQGGQLMSIKSQMQLDWFSNTLSIANYWVGARARYPDDFKWLDGSSQPVWSKWWGGNEPNNAHGTNRLSEGCVGYYKPSSGFNDYPCTWSFPYVCETKSSFNLCPNRYELLDAVICVMYVSTPNNWKAAQQDCENRGGETGRLMVVRSQTQFAWLETLTGPLTHIGLRTYQYPAIWTWLNGDTHTNISWWNSGEPNNAGSVAASTFVNEACAGFAVFDMQSLRNAILYDDVCSVTLSFICEIRTTCHVNAFSSNMASWPTATSQCAALGGTLAVARNDAEFTQLQTIHKDNVLDLWVGAKANGTASPVTFYWKTGDLLNPASAWWGDAQPNQVAETCVAITLGMANKLDDTDCPDTKRYICEYPVCPITKICAYPTFYDNLADECVSCFTIAFSSNYSNWNTAQARCSKLGGKLSCARNQAQFDALSYMSQNQDLNLWVGGQTYNVPGNWSWLSEFDNYLSVDSSWWSRLFVIDPDNRGGSFTNLVEACAMLADIYADGNGNYFHSNNLLNDLDCSQLVTFSCEYDICDDPSKNCTATEYFDVTTGNCLAKLSYGDDCSSHSQCDSSKGLQCTSYGCDCFAGYHWNVTRGECVINSLEFSCFLYSHVLKDLSWEAANADCQAKGGNLASARNQSEFDQLINIAANHKNNSNFWLGANTTNIVGNWSWLNGGYLSYYNARWISPPDNDNAKCLTLLNHNSSTYDPTNKTLLKSDDCALTQPYICEYNLCPPLIDNCTEYVPSINQYKDFSPGFVPDSGICKTSKIMDQTCSAHIECDAWLGLECVSAQPTDLCQCQDRTVQWLGSRCDVATTTTTSAPLRACPDGWHQNCSYCIKPFESTLNWPQALQSCESEGLGGRLHVVQTQAQFEFLVELLDGDVNNYWLGFVAIAPGNWTWLTGTEIPLSSDWWQSSAPYSADEACGVWAASSLNGSQCGENLKYLCETLANLNADDVSFCPGIPLEAIFIGDMVIRYGPIDVAGMSAEQVVAILRNYTGDLYGCMANCSGSGQCQLTQDGIFSCACHEYFDGIACQNNLHPCSTMPCMNGAKCIESESEWDDKTLSFMCNCSIGYEGGKCESAIDYCSVQAMSCSGKGNCYVNVTTPLCRCYGGYLGENCETESGALAALKKMVTSFSYLAFTILALLYTTFVLMDVSGRFCKLPKPLKRHAPKKFRYLDFKD